MKYIKTINELYKSTYISAADKFRELGDEHAGRAKDLENWSTKGKSSFENPKSKDFKEHYYPFSLHWGGGVTRNVNYYATFAWCDGESIAIKFMSDYGKEAFLMISEVSINNIVRIALSRMSNGKRITAYKFDTRKEAVELKKFLSEYFTDAQKTNVIEKEKEREAEERGEEYFPEFNDVETAFYLLDQLNINTMYTPSSVTPKTLTPEEKHKSALSNIFSKPTSA